jgi:hypothetical protein
MMRAAGCAQKLATGNIAYRLWMVVVAKLIGLRAALLGVKRR